MVSITSPTGNFCIDSTEVTNSQYADFLAANPSTTQQPAECAWNSTFRPSSGWPATASERPVAFVDWCDAAAYCRWAGKSLCGRIDNASPLNEVDATSSQSQWYQACTQGGTQPVPYGSSVNTQACPMVSSLEDVTSRPCCASVNPRVYGLNLNASEWLNACTGTSGITDTCRIAGATSSSSTACMAAVRSVARNSALPTTSFRCCSP
jgi:formylglycine-generating enzyme required for sulfatase activity